jgi:type IX secretion system substrate protein/pregnancy-associated plasma protein-A
MKKIFTTLLLALLCAAVWAQSNKQCGTDTAPEDDSLYLELVMEMNMDTTPVITNPRYIPLFYHIVRQSDGTGGADMTALDDALVELNHQFDSVAFKFFRCEEPDYIDDDLYFSQVVQNSAEANALATDNARPGVINLFFVPALLDGNGTDTLCGYARFPWQGGNYIFMENDCAANSSSLTHQLGHYFGLYHTHHSSATIAPEHVTRVETDTCFNCATTGDLLCDTDADPGLSGATVDASCTYNGVVKDSCSDATPAQILDYTPDVTNFMSFSRKDCRNAFSPGQFDRMHGFYLSTRLPELDAMLCTNSPCYDDVTLPLGADVVSVVKTIRASNSISSTETIDVQDSPGVVYKAGGYVSMEPGFETTGGSIFTAFIEECQAFAPPVNEDFLIVPQDQPGILIAPNPASGAVTLWFKLPEEGEVHLQVLSATGQVMDVVADGVYSKGMHTVQWDAGQLKGGMYFVLLRQQGKQAVQKMVKLDSN